MARLFHDLVAALRKLVKPAPRPVPTVRVMPPSTKIDPLSAVLYYRGQANHVVVREAFTFGQWVGEHNMVANIVCPGDGTLRVVFEHPEDLLMFTLQWSEKIKERSPREYSGGSTGPR